MINIDVMGKTPAQVIICEKAHRRKLMKYKLFSQGHNKVIIVCKSHKLFIVFYDSQVSYNVICSCTETELSVVLLYCDLLT